MPYHPPIKFNKTFLEQALLEKLVSTGQLSEESYSKLRDHEGKDPESAALLVGLTKQEYESIIAALKDMPNYEMHRHRFRRALLRIEISSLCVRHNPTIGTEKVTVDAFSKFHELLGCCASFHKALHGWVEDMSTAALTHDERIQVYDAITRDNLWPTVVLTTKYLAQVLMHLDRGEYKQQRARIMTELASTDFFDRELKDYYSLVEIMRCLSSEEAVWFNSIVRDKPQLWAKIFSTSSDFEAFLTFPAIKLEHKIAIYKIFQRENPRHFADIVPSVKDEEELDGGTPFDTFVELMRLFPSTEDRLVIISQLAVNYHDFKDMMRQYGDEFQAYLRALPPELVAAFVKALRQQDKIKVKVITQQDLFAATVAQVAMVENTNLEQSSSCLSCLTAVVDYVSGLFQQEESICLQLTTAQTQAVINAYCRDAVSQPVQVSTATDGYAFTRFFATVSSKAKSVVATASDITATLCKR